MIFWIMKQLLAGQFHGETNNTTHLNGLILTDTEYTHDKVDWHYHENAYFTFILQGNIIEGNRKEVYRCSQGSLLFHNWQEPHYNTKPAGFTRGFHIELGSKWLEHLNLSVAGITGSMDIQNIDIKLSLYRIFKETKINDETSPLSIESLVVQVLAQMQQDTGTSLKKNSVWVNKIKEILNDTFSEKLTLAGLSNDLDIHPGHLSRDFSKHFNCTLGTYIRKLKIERSLSLLSRKNFSLSDIAFECGFADQSHFIRSFKEMMSISPSAYRKLIQS